MTIINKITPQMVVHFKTVRLRALADSPSAFCSTYLRESRFTDEEWKVRAERWNGERGAGYMALGDGGYCGIAGCFLKEDDARKADLVSMWVAPEARRGGVGRLLVDAVVLWAADHGAQDLYLMVTSGNHAAIEFYERYGFSMTGRTEPYPNDPKLIEYEMSKHISG
jgi:GNAT superfamily N-acetyltransferase